MIKRVKHQIGVSTIAVTLALSNGLPGQAAAQSASDSSADTPQSSAAQQQQPSSTRQRQQSARQQQSGSAQNQQTRRVLVVSAGEIAQNPDRFYGKRVQVRAPVEEVHGRTVFTLDEDQLFAGPDVLVLAPGGTTAPREDRTATVTGTVRQFASADIYQDYDWFGYGWYGYNWGDYNDVWAEWETRPVIMADSIRTENGRELVLQQTNERPTRQTRSRQKVYVASPGEIAQSPRDYYGTMVSVRSDVAESFNPQAFTLDEDRVFVVSDLLVLVPRPAGQAAEGRNVTVIGMVRPFVQSQFERDYDWFDPSLIENTEVLAEWERDRRPVIIARSIRTENGRELVQGPTTRREAVGGTTDASERKSKSGGQGRSGASSATPAEPSNSSETNQ